MSAFTTGELMAVEMSRHLADGEVAIMGAYSALPMLACRLAQLTHAPNLSFIAGGSGAVNPRLEPLMPSSCDDSLLRAEAVLPLSEVIDMEARPEVDVFFAGGLQIDKAGNCNLIGVGPYERLMLRGPGSVGLPFVSRAGRTVIYALGHDVRTFVEKVDHVSGPGASEGLPGGGPSVIVTPKCVIEFAGGKPHLRTAHPGHTGHEVAESTGFELVIPDDLEETEPPSERELEIMRTVDPMGVARGT